MMKMKINLHHSAPLGIKIFDILLQVCGIRVFMSASPTVM